MGFGGEKVDPKEKIEVRIFKINCKDGKLSCGELLFIFYNVILGRPTLHELGAAPSTYYQVMKFPTPQKIEAIRTEHKAFRSVT